MAQFLTDVLHDLGQTPKRLASKYFYDATGDALFQRIMSCDEYYLTRCEAQIFSTHAAKIAACLREGNAEFDLIELGAGDASKTVHLLRALAKCNSDFAYVPIDISASIIRQLEEQLPEAIPGLTVRGLHGEYLDMLRQAQNASPKPKVILFLGSSIGNLTPEGALEFCKAVRETMNVGDRLLIGFDLKKHPADILAAYNDSAGYTRAFNLNLLTRINRELDGDFDVDAFDHYPTYDPLSGACRSFLVSTVPQQVHIATSTFSFQRNEVIHMEISQKYSPDDIDKLAQQAGFTVTTSFTDTKNWFVDAIWSAKA